MITPFFGSFNETGLASDFCFDRHARYDPYGYDEKASPKEKMAGRRIPPTSVEWDKVNWGDLQKDCYLRNEDRYEPFRRPNGSTLFRMPVQSDQSEVSSTLVYPPQEEEKGRSYRLWQAKRKSYKERTAVVLRAWDGMEWTIDTMQYVRSYIMELSLHSGAEYEVILLVEVKDTTIPIFEDTNAYQDKLFKAVPDEFKDITLLFSRDLLEKWYPKVGKHEYVSLYLAQ